MISKKYKVLVKHKKVLDETIKEVGVHRYAMRYHATEGARLEALLWKTVADVLPELDMENYTYTYDKGIVKCTGRL